MDSSVPAQRCSMMPLALSTSPPSPNSVKISLGVDKHPRSRGFSPVSLFPLLSDREGLSPAALICAAKPRFISWHTPLPASQFSALLPVHHRCACHSQQCMVGIVGIRVLMREISHLRLEEFG